SLTEEPEAEIPVAKALIARYSDRAGHDPIPDLSPSPWEKGPGDEGSPLLGRGVRGEGWSPFTHQRRHTREVLNIGARHVPVVMADLSSREKITPATLFPWGYRYSVPLDKWNLNDQACDYIFIGKNSIDFEIPGTLGVVQEHKVWLRDRNKDRHYPFLQPKEYLGG